MDNAEGMPMMKRDLQLVITVVALAVAVGCAKKTPNTQYPPAPNPGTNVFSGAGGAPGTERPPDAGSPPGGSTIASRPIPLADQPGFTEASPLQVVLFSYDSDEVDDAGKKVLAANAGVLKTNRTWVVTVEGHCDERGTAEYNLALGDRRAQAAKNYLVSLGIGAERLRTVSYGKEFPFDPAHTESAWAKNRRAHFMVTAK
jgi:peptidoglycan-associated lipoprotein